MSLHVRSERVVSGDVDRADDLASLGAVGCPDAAPHPVLHFEIEERHAAVSDVAGCSAVEHERPVVSATRPRSVELDDLLLLRRVNPSQGHLAATDREVRVSELDAPLGSASQVTVVASRQEKEQHKSLHTYMVRRSECVAQEERGFSELGDSRPDVAANNLLDVAAGETERLCECPRASSKTPKGADIYHVGLGETGGVVQDAEPRWPVSTPPARDHIGRVLNRGASVQVLRSHARRIVAAMANVHSVRNLTVRHGERHAMSKVRAPLESNDSVPGWILGSDPPPAPVSLADAEPKPRLEQEARTSDWPHHSREPALENVRAAQTATLRLGRCPTAKEGACHHG